MSLVAVGAYLKTLRDARGLTLADVASLSQTSETQVIRIESGKIDTRGSLLMRIIHAVEGSADDILRLSLVTEATDGDGLELYVQQGKEVAQRLLATQKQGQAESIFARLVPDHQRLLTELARALLGEERQ